MTTLLTLPRLGETMETGRVVGWLKQPGETFRRGETIVEIESDKTVVELPALADGTLVEVIAAEGAEVDVGGPLCRYEPADGAAPAEPIVPLESPAPTPVPFPPALAEPPAVATAGQRPRATPVARRLARQDGVDLATVAGSGRRGRIEARDVRAAGGGGSGSAEGLAVRHWTPPGAARGTVLLLHGFAGDAQTWAALAALLVRQGLHVTAPDLPGHGTTRLDASEIADLAAPLGALLGERPVELVGHSLGGAVAVALARAYPDRIARVTLIAPAGLDSGIDAELIDGLATVRAPGALAHLLRRLSTRPLALSSAQLAQMAAALGEGRLRTLAGALVAEGRQQIDILPDLEALAMPARVIWGLEDRIIPWTQVARLPSRVAVHLIAGAGHVPQWDAPQRVAELFGD